MKVFKKVATALMALTLAVSLAACASNNGASNSSVSTKIPTKITKKTTIVFWHAMMSNRQAELKKLTEQFEQQNPNIKVKLQLQGTYEQLQAKVKSTLPTPNNLPTITQGYPESVYSAMQNKMLVDLKPYMKAKNIGWGKADNGLNKDFLASAQINGVQYALPFNKSILVLYYNKDLLKKYDVAVPTTMDEVNQAAKKIYDKSKGKVVGFGYDFSNLANYYMIGMKNQGQNFTEKINFAGKASKKVINWYAKGVRGGYFRQAGTDGNLSKPFANQKLAMFVGSNGGEDLTRQAIGKNFEYGVAKLPSTYNVGQGANIYMFSQASAMQKAAAFKYMKFLVSKEAQTDWAKATGYIPVNQAALNSSAYKNSGLKGPQVLDPNQKLYSVPATKNAGSAFHEVESIMQSILAQAAKGNWQNEITQGKAKFDASWKQ